MRVCAHARARAVYCSFEEPQSIGLSQNFPVLKELRLKLTTIFRFSYILTLRVHAYTKMTLNFVKGLL